MPLLFFLLTSSLCQPGESHLLAQAMAWGHWCWLGGAGQPGHRHPLPCHPWHSRCLWRGCCRSGSLQQLQQVQAVLWCHICPWDGDDRVKKKNILTPFLLSYTQSVNAQAQQKQFAADLLDVITLHYSDLFWLLSISLILFTRKQNLILHKTSAFGMKLHLHWEEINSKCLSRPLVSVWWFPCL